MCKVKVSSGAGAKFMGRGKGGLAKLKLGWVARESFRSCALLFPSTTSASQATVETQPNGNEAQIYEVESPFNLAKGPENGSSTR